MQRVEAGRDLHALRAVDGVAVGHVDAGLLQRRTAVREAVLDDQVLRALGVDERRDVGALGGDDRRDVLAAELLELLADGVRRARGDLVDHAPREGDLRLVGDVIDERLGDEALLQPLLRHGEDGGTQLLAVVAAVVHGDDGDGRLAGFKAVIKQRADDRHRGGRLLRAVVDVGLDEREEVARGVAKRIALLRDGEGEHLQARVGEDLLEAAPARRDGGLRLDRLGQGADDLLVGRRVRVERDGEDEVVVRIVDLVHHVEIERLHAGDAAVHVAAGQQPVGDAADEDTEDVARAEMHPDRVLAGLLRDGLHVIGGQADAGLLPRGGVLDSLKCQPHR